MELIKDFKDYCIDESSDLYSAKFNKFKKMKLTLNSGGYLHVRLCKNGKTYSKLVHRLVAQAFIPNPENKRTVNHKNGIKTDNRVSNLEWMTHSENTCHAWNNGVCENTRLAVSKACSKSITISKNGIKMSFKSQTDCFKFLEIIHTGNLKRYFNKGYKVKGWNILSMEMSKNIGTNK